jgi:hypothetical protein
MEYVRLLYIRVKYIMSEARQHNVYLHKTNIYDNVFSLLKTISYKSLSCSDISLYAKSFDSYIKITNIVVSKYNYWYIQFHIVDFYDKFFILTLIMTKRQIEQFLFNLLQQ